MATCEEGSQRCHPQMFPVTTPKIRVTGDNQVENKIRNYTFTENKVFHKDFMLQEGSELLQLPKCVNWPISLKTLTYVTFLKIHLGFMLVSSEILQTLSPLSFPPSGHNYKHASQAVLATKGKAERAIETSSEEEEGDGKAKSPGATNIYIRALPVLTWMFLVWSCACPPITMITAKAHSEWKALR